MKVILSILGLTISFSCLSANRYLDSSATHPYVKLTLFPFLTDNRALEGSFAFGPSASLSGKKFEMQCGVLYDILKYQRWKGNHFSSSYDRYRKLFLLLQFNYHFFIS